MSSECRWRSTAVRHMPNRKCSCWHTQLACHGPMQVMSTKKRKEKKRKEEKRKEKKRKEKKRKEKKRKEKKRKEKKRKEKKRKEKKRKDYVSRRQFNEKPSIIPGCPGSQKGHSQQYNAHTSKTCSVNVHMLRQPQDIKPDNKVCTFQQS